MCETMPSDMTTRHESETVRVLVRVNARVNANHAESKTEYKTRRQRKSHTMFPHPDRRT